MTPEQQRGKILQILYEESARDSSEALESEDLAQRVGLPWDKIRLEVSYLEEKGYIVSKRRPLGTRIFRTFFLTARGIDLLEGRASDGTVAPAVYNINNIKGDFVYTEIGNHARGVAAGKQITQQQGIVDDAILIERLYDTLSEFLDYLDEEGQSLLTSEEIAALKRKIIELTALLRRADLLR